MTVLTSCPKCGSIDSIVVEERCRTISKVDRVVFDGEHYDYLRGELVVQETSDFWISCSKCGALLDKEDVKHIDVELEDVARRVVDKMSGSDLDTFVYNMISSYVERGDTEKISELMRAWEVKATRAMKPLWEHNV
jgi:phage FluMu protein Com